MKDNLLDTLKDLLLESIENTLSKPENELSNSENNDQSPDTKTVNKIADPSDKSFRILDEEECVKLNIYCQNFLHRVERLGLLLPTGREAIIDQLMDSEADYIGFDEVKWTFINSLNATLTERELVFLDFILNDNINSVQ